MRCIVVVLLALAGAHAAAAASADVCARTEDFFLRHEVSAVDGDEPGPVCGGQCCGREREAQLRAALLRAAGRRAAAVRPVAELLRSTRATLQEHLKALSHQSQNKTAEFFAKVYRGHESRVHALLGALYGELRAALQPAPAPAPSPLALRPDPPRDLAAATRHFFRELFPLAYHNVLRLDSKQFTPEYEVCLKDAYDAVQPFGEVPQQLGTTLAQALEEARALLAALGAGAGALEGSEAAVARAAGGCSARLLRAAGCAPCRGLDARPCRHYCLNVVRGCMGSAVAELEAPWARFVAGAERLARADADAALRELDARVSQAIMHAFENHQMLDKKVRQECGEPATEEGSAGAAARARASGPGAGAGAGAGRREALRAPPPAAELLQFAASLSATKKLFSTLLDQFCEEPDFAQNDNEHCWNGVTVGEYTKPLVASSSLSDQKYNPEVEGSAPPDPAVAALAERLRQARQLLVSCWSSGGGGGAAPAAEAVMQGDEAGSGSGGGRAPYDDAAFDAEGSGDEGSGHDPDDTRMAAGEPPAEAAPPRAGGAARPAAASALALLLLLARAV